ncbi:sugar transporter [Cryptosporidium ryanae]|uniref:sugar transporter n=1 Tax=Cryptosporidium ryanae TaxID=515981 RepID=UPI00351A8EF1|nr:sugar transporter [Cryptosporidium ryanae]
MLVHYLVPSSVSLKENSESLIFSGTSRIERSIMKIVNSSIFFGSSIGSLIEAIISNCLGKVKTLLVSFLLFAIGSLLCVKRNLLIFSLGRFLCGIGVGISFLLVPSYIQELTNKQNQNLFLALHKVMFCCGVLLSYLLCNIIPSFIKYFIKEFLTVNINYKLLINLQNYYKELLSKEYSNKNEIIIKLYKYHICSTISTRILFSIPLIISVSLLIIFFFKKFDETPLYYIKMRDISRAEEIVREIYGVVDTRKIMKQLIDESRVNSPKPNLFKIFTDPSLRMALIFTLIVIFTGVSTGFVPLTMSSKIFTQYLNINHNLSAIIIALSGCFLVIFTFSGIFFEVYIGSRKLLLFGLILNLASLTSICFFLYYYNQGSVIKKIVIIAFLAATTSYGFGIIPTISKIISNNILKQLYYTFIPFILVFFWLTAAFATILIELLPIPVMIFIYSFLTFFSLASISIINYKYTGYSDQVLKDSYITT